MIDAYEISDDELKLTKEEKAVIRTTTSNDPHFIKRWLVFGVGQFTNTKSWYTGKSERSFCGLPADVDFAGWLLEALTRFVQAELVEYLAQSLFVDGHERRVALRSFVIGCTRRITDRLSELSKPHPTQSNNARALVVTKKTLVDECIKAAGLKFGSGSCRAPAGDAAAYSAGKAAGERATFGRPVTGAAAVLQLRGRS
jgi:hypothetical protein